VAVRVAAHINDNGTSKNQDVILAGSNLHAIMSLDTSDGLQFALCADDRDGDYAFLRGPVVPGVTSSVLNHAVTRLETNLSSVVQFEIDFARDNHVEVHRVGRVHARMSGFQDFHHPRQLLLNFFESRCDVDLIHARSYRAVW
jgi:hypothetical protein